MFKNSDSLARNCGGAACTALWAILLHTQAETYYAHWPGEKESECERDGGLWGCGDAPLYLRLAEGRFDVNLLCAHVLDSLRCQNKMKENKRSRNSGRAMRTGALKANTLSCLPALLPPPLPLDTLATGMHCTASKGVSQLRGGKIMSDGGKLCWL